MVESVSKLPVKVEKKGSEVAPQAWRPFEGFRQQVERLFDDFEQGVWRSPFRGSLFSVEPSRGGVAWAVRRRSTLQKAKRLSRSRPNCPAWTRRTSK